MSSPGTVGKSAGAGDFGAGPDGRLASSSVVSILLAALCLLDAGGAGIAFFAPERWFQDFHAAAYIDPQGLLRRMGANWAAFAVLQAVAWFRWRDKPEWLCIVAGARLGDVLTDWTVLAFAATLTLKAKLLFGAAGPVNLLTGLFLIHTYAARGAPSFKDPRA